MLAGRRAGVCGVTVTGAVALDTASPDTRYTPGMSTRRILVVDDEPKLARTLKAILAGNGFEPLLAATGEEALDLLDRHHLDLVLLDLVLPGIDGLAVC